MRVQKIYSKNADYQKFEVLKNNRNKRHKYGQFFVEGVRNINEAIKNNWKIHSFLFGDYDYLSDWARNCIETVDTQINFQLTPSLMQEISNKSDTSELAAIVGMREEDVFDISMLSENPLIAMFDRPSNKGNLGTVIRSCDALGIEALIIAGHCVDMYDPETLAASMGSFFKVPTIKMNSNDKIDDFIFNIKLKYNNINIIGTSAHADCNIYDCDLTIPTLFMIGNETDGICQKFNEISNIMVKIPMHEYSSASSFNVACAATIIFYEAVRQRNLLLQ